jgi:hypothetical protein
MSVTKHWQQGEWYLRINHVSDETLTTGRMIPSDKPCQCWNVDNRANYTFGSFALLSMFRHWHGLSEGIIRPVVNVSALTWFIRRYHPPSSQCFVTDMVYPKASFDLLSMFRHWHGLSEGIIRPVVNVSALTWFIRRYHPPCCQCFGTDMVYPKVSFALLSIRINHVSAETLTTGRMIPSDKPCQWRNIDNRANDTFG